jgi:type II secretory pathway predicted ATPase ExeA
VYFEHFGLKEAPFRITPNTEYWHPGGQRGEILAALLYAIDQGEGIIKVVGEVGSGKTMLCRKLAALLPGHIDSVYLGNPALSPDDMLVAILAELGATPRKTSRQARLAALDAALLARHKAGRRVVVLVEEAQGVPLETLEFLRLLTNLETASDKLLQIVLFGQPELDALLAEPRIRQLKDRITLSLKLSPLGTEEVAAYMRARLAVAGYRGPDLFPPTLVARMTKLSAGLSRRINLLADKALLAAYAERTHNLAPRHLEAAAADAEMTPPALPAFWRRLDARWIWLAGGLAAALGLLAFVAWMARVPLSPQPVAPPASLPPAASPTAATPATPEQAPDVRTMARQAMVWLAEAAPQTRVIQLGSAKEAGQAAVLLAELKARPHPEPLRVLYGTEAGRPAWMILAGEYTDRAEARAALASVTAQASGSPFLRTVGTMRTVVLPPE